MMMLEHGAENGLWYSAGDHHLVRQLGLVQQLTDQKPVESYAIANVPPSSGAFYPKIRPTFTRTRARNYSTVIQCVSSSWSKVFVTGGSSWTGLATTSEIASRRVTEARSVMIDGNGRARARDRVTIPSQKEKQKIQESGQVSQGATKVNHDDTSVFMPSPGPLVIHSTDRWSGLSTVVLSPPPASKVARHPVSKLHGRSNRRKGSA
ncbi:hypothetical protein POX_d04931 [Penicillium oxalicum]|uniref:hypothetical protein n=1 Tax=Penicillium oxalicum TaxID=69781 RepID=UPI0020B709C2|nr:hypothetical protein POX_d04931 [Penicillium oxalicum]KAI2789442.1 hypothetical protein POX_d04931 [Penicillium oxalicum]